MFIGNDNALYLRRNNWLLWLLLRLPVRWLLITQGRVGNDYTTWIRVSFKSNP